MAAIRNLAFVQPVKIVSFMIENRFRAICVMDFATVEYRAVTVSIARNLNDLLVFNPFMPYISTSILGVTVNERGF